MHVMMKATDQCNMRCTYCYVPLEQRESKECLSLKCMPSIFRKIFDWQQSVSSTDEVHFNWSGGEMLTVPIDWWQEMIRIQKETHDSGDYTIKYKNSVQTNMTLMDEKISKFLFDNKISIGISMDGPKHCMDNTRVLADGQSAFDLIIKNLQYFHETYNSLPGVIVVLTKHNVRHLEEVFSFFNDLKIGFQINSYHFAPSSAARDQSNSLTAKEYLEAMCHLFDLWSEREDSVSIANFKRITRFLLHGNTEVCRDRPVCADHFYMVKWNGDVYPCNEFSGAEFERDYCYGNLIEQDWREIRDHPTRKLMFERKSRIEQAVDECKSCRYWEGCYGGCFHCALKYQYRHSGDCSPQKIVEARDIEHCTIHKGLYQYIERKLRQQAKNNLLPVLLYTDTVSKNEKERKSSFYNFHTEKWEASTIDEKLLSAPLHHSQLKRLSAQLIGKNDILHICCGSGSLLDFVTEEHFSANVVGVDYRFLDYEMTFKSYGRIKQAKCDNILNWQGWESDRKWDAILFDPYFIHPEDISDLLTLCRAHLSDSGVIIPYSLACYLREKDLLDITGYQGVKEYNSDVIPINSGDMSLAVLC